MPPRVRPLRADEHAEVELVAARMRDTLIEVLGPERGGSMYSMEWLVQRARWHLDPANCVGCILVAEGEAGEIVGHSVVRVEPDDLEPGGLLGLFSTFYVLPARRRAGLAGALLSAGEAWLLRAGATRLGTNTSATNWPLIRLFEARGYAVTLRAPEVQMVHLSRAVRPSQAAAGDEPDVLPQGLPRQEQLPIPEAELVGADEVTVLVEGVVAALDE